MKKLLLIVLLFAFCFKGYGQIITTIVGNGTLGYSGDWGAATAAELHGPSSVAVDGSGNIYIADEHNNCIRRVNTSGVISTFAGNGIAGFGGDGGAATAAELFWPKGIMIDGAGNVYIADDGNSRIRKVKISGIINTFAGNGTPGYSGDGGAATAAELHEPCGIAIDGSGNIYIAESWNHCIRKVNSFGIINTYAGNGTNGFSGDGGPASVAELCYPYAISFDGSGNLYIADNGNNRIRKINSSGLISTFAGNGTSGFSGDGGAATDAELYAPAGVTVDIGGNVFIVDELNQRIRKINNSGVISTYAGNGISGYSGDGGQATSADLNYPWGLTVDLSGNILIADWANNRVRKVGSCSLPSVGTITGSSTVTSGTTITLTDTTNGGTWSASNSHTTISSGVVTGVSEGIDTISYAVTNSCGTATVTFALSVDTLIGGSPCNIITTIAGNGIPGYSGDGGAATDAELLQPYSVAVDATGNVYIASQLENRILKVNNIGVISTYAGNGTAGYSGDGSAATDAELNGPYSVAVDISGNVYIADYGNNRIRKVNSSGAISTYAGNGTGGYSGDGGLATAAELNGPFCVTFDVSGNVYISDFINNSIRKVNSSGVISTYAGNGIAGYSGDGGAAIDAELRHPGGITVDVSGNFYIADVYNNCIRKVNSSGIISTFAGSSIAGYSGDGGDATLAELNTPYGVAIDILGNVYIDDELNNRIRKVNNSGVISTYTGNGTRGYSGDGGAATDAELHYPACVSVDIVGNVYIADWGNNRIRKIGNGSMPFVGTISGPTGLCPGSSITYSDATTGGTWSSSNLATASINPSTGIATGIAVGVTTISYTVTNSCGTAVATKTITVSLIPAVSAITGPSLICMGSLGTMADSVSGGSWSSSNTAVATISPMGYVSGVSAGTATISYVYTNSCGTAYTTKTITVSPMPSAGSITGASTLCVGGTATLTSPASGGVWSSTAPGIASIGLSTGVATGVAVGTATISYTVTNSCGTANAVRNITVNPLPVSSFTGPASVCVGSTVTMSPTVSGGTWTRSNSNASISTGGVVTGLAAGLDNITYTVTNSCGSTNNGITITVNPLPAIGVISGSTGMCLGTTATLTNSAPGGTWGAINTNATITSGGVVSAMVSGIDTITYLVSNGTCTANAVTIISIDTMPTGSFITGMPEVCAGTTYLYSASVSGGIWGTTNTLGTINTTGSFTAITTGVDTILYTLTNSCGTGSSSYVVSIISLPTAGVIVGPANICLGSTAMLYSSMPGGSWLSTNNVVATIGATGLVSGISLGTDTIKYTYTNMCGVASTYRVITIETMPTVAGIAGPDSVCVGNAVTLTDGTSGGVWTVTTSAAGALGGGVFTGITPGTDTCIYTITGACASVSAQHTLVVSGCTTGIGGIDENSTLGIMVFPNPSKGNFTVKLPDASSPATVSVSDVYGKEVFSGNLTKSETAISLDNVANGTYFIKVAQWGNVYREKVVVLGR